MYTGCPPKSGTLDFCYSDIRKYSIHVCNYVLILHPSLEAQSLHILLNLCELFTAGMAVHKFSLCFVCTDQWVSGQQCMEVSKTIIPDSNITRMKRKSTTFDYVLRNDHRIKTTQPISMILVSFFSEDNVLKLLSDEICFNFFFLIQWNLFITRSLGP